MKSEHETAMRELVETHKACNERLVNLFGFTVEEWSATQPFLGPSWP